MYTAVQPVQSLLQVQATTQPNTLQDLFPLTYCSDQDPYSYTSGRWLHKKRKSRHIKFNFPALCDKAISVCPGATRIIPCEKRGGFSRVFLLAMDNGSHVVARLPTSISGPPKLTTNSEVATMAYCEWSLWYMYTCEHTNSYFYSTI